MSQYQYQYHQTPRKDYTPALIVKAATAEIRSRHRGYCKSIDDSLGHLERAIEMEVEGQGFFDSLSGRIPINPSATLMTYLFEPSPSQTCPSTYFGFVPFYHWILSTCDDSLWDEMIEKYVHHRLKLRKQGQESMEDGFSTALKTLESLKNRKEGATAQEVSVDTRQQWTSSVGTGNSTPLLLGSSSALVASNSDLHRPGRTKALGEQSITRIGDHQLQKRKKPVCFYTAETVEDTIEKVEELRTALGYSLISSLQELNAGDRVFIFQTMNENARDVYADIQTYLDESVARDASVHIVEVSVYLPSEKPADRSKIATKIPSAKVILTNLKKMDYKKYDWADVDEAKQAIRVAAIH